MACSHHARNRRSTALIVSVLLCIHATGAFVPTCSRPTASATTCTATAVTKEEVVMLFSRRCFWKTSGMLLFVPSKRVLASTTTDIEADKAKIVKGYERLTYLLNNWDTLTTNCGVERDPFSGEQVCEKTPLVVQDYIGYKSMNDPLFKADKTLRRLEDLVPANKDGEYFEAVEKWSAAAEEASGMAYTSSWAGPQNPNGGDLSIAYYLDRAKKQATDARAALKTVIDILQLKQ